MHLGTSDALYAHIAHREAPMNAVATNYEPSRIVLVVGVDMSDVSEHLLAQTRDLIRPMAEAEVHVVHVVRPEPLPQRLVRPRNEEDVGARYQVEYAKWALERLSEALSQHPGTRVIVHTPVGGAAEELTRIAAQVNADVLIVEAHDPHTGVSSIFHRSTLSRIARTAPCTVVTIRKPHSAEEAPPSTTEPVSRRWSSASP
jgi:nucleotide-binding universal stress UspA family protein